MPTKSKTNQQSRHDKSKSKRESHFHTHERKSVQSISVTKARDQRSYSKPLSTEGESKKSHIQEGSIGNEWQDSTRRESYRQSTQCSRHMNSTKTKKALTNCGEMSLKTSKASNCRDPLDKREKTMSKKCSTAPLPDLMPSAGSASKVALGSGVKPGSLIRFEKDKEVILADSASRGRKVCKVVKTTPCHQRPSQNGAHIANYVYVDVTVNGNVIINTKR